jgi:hypothetical protein
MAPNPDRGPGRIEFRADDPSLTPYAGLAISGELARGLRLVELTEVKLAAAARVAPVKQRRRGLGGFKRSSQRWLVDMIADTRPTLRRESSIRVSCEGGC